MAQPNQDPLSPTPGATPPPAGSPPTPVDQHAELRATLDRVVAEKEAILADATLAKRSLGRVRQELGLEKGTTDEETFADSIRQLRALKKAGGVPAVNGNGDPGPKTYTEEEVAKAIAENRVRQEQEYQVSVQTAQKERDDARRLWDEDRVETRVTAGCSQLGLDPDLVMSRLRDPRNPYDWTIESDPTGASKSGVRVVKKGDSTKAPYFDRASGKYLELGDALALVAKDKPGVVLSQPRTGGGARDTGGPAPLPHRNPADMTPEEKVRGAFRP